MGLSNRLAPWADGEQWRNSGPAWFSPRLCDNLGHRSQKMVLRTSLPGENTPKFQFWKPNPLFAGMVAQIPLKKHFFSSQ
jgi:hypothetical protein